MNKRPSLKTFKSVAARLKSAKFRLVLAESCTGGLLAARFSEIPGISEFFCGSHVVYREDSKIRWLGVKRTTLSRFSAVSTETAEEMVRGALTKTPEANIAGAVTGYLGPSGDQVGKVFISVLLRGEKTPLTAELDLLKLDGKMRSPITARLLRREQAAEGLLLLLLSALSPGSTSRARKTSRRM